jgi:hypothetical protein
MDEFDGIRQITSFERFSGHMTEILMSPAYLLWNSWASKNLPDIVEMILFLMNSVLWGTTLDLIYSNFLRHKAKREPI